MEHLSKPQKCLKNEHVDLTGRELPVTGKFQAEAYLVEKLWRKGMNL